MTMPPAGNTDLWRFEHRAPNKKQVAATSGLTVFVVLRTRNSCRFSNGKRLSGWLHDCTAPVECCWQRGERKELLNFLLYAKNKIGSSRIGSRSRTSDTS